VCPASCVSIVIRTVSGFDCFSTTFFAAGFLAVGLVGAFLLVGFLLVGFFVVINCYST